MRSLLWFRGKDLRLSDHAALAAALEGKEVIPLFVLDPYFFAPGSAQELPHRMQYLLGALAELEARIGRLGSRLLVVEGRSVEVVPRLAKAWKVDQVLAMRWSEPLGRCRDVLIGQALAVPFRLFEGETLLPPDTLHAASGRPYAVFTAFARAFQRESSIGAALPAPLRLPPLPAGVRAETVAIPTLERLGLHPNAGLLQGGELAAQARLRAFLAGPAARYHLERDRLDLGTTSRLSADLHFGTLSVRTLWQALGQALSGSATQALTTFRNELLWREFAHSTLWDHPEMLRGPLRPGFRGFPWREDGAGWTAWTQGETGYPVVDAAARQLLAEGFVHNRARMIAASFLVKDLLIDYRRGEAHYLKYLSDGDAAQNNAGWQWCLGSGFDAQPYFRIFNPVLQGQKFDPTGAYVRRWVPELAPLPDKWIHRPWEAPLEVMKAAGLVRGRDYPDSIVGHAAARDRFLMEARSHFGGGTSYTEPA